MLTELYLYNVTPDAHCQHIANQFQCDNCHEDKTHIFMSRTLLIDNFFSPFASQLLSLRMLKLLQGHIN